MKDRIWQWQVAHLPQLTTYMNPRKAYRTMQKIMMRVPDILKLFTMNKRRKNTMNHLINNHIATGFRHPLQSVAAFLAAQKNGGLQSKRLFQSFLTLLLISAMAFSSLPAMASEQEKQSKEKADPKTGLSAGQQNQSKTKIDQGVVSSASQYPDFKGKIDPKLVMSADKKWYLFNKFSKQGDKKVPLSGRYRVSIVGFVCANETRDDIFAWDGLSDEIRLNVETQVVDRDRELLLQGQAQTRVMGSVNGDDWRRIRVQAGTADRFGGVRTGDSVPSSPAYAPRTDPANPELPFLLFEGDLIQGMNAVTVIPTIWEVDGGAGLWPRFQSALAAALPSIITSTATLAGGPGAGTAIAPAAEATIGAIDRLMTGIRGGDGGDRVIGIHGETFSPRVIRLNYDIAELALRTRIGGPAPAGIIPIVYRDEGDLNGNYTLYVKIERILPVIAPD
jgi:hypothetical protein